MTVWIVIQKEAKHQRIREVFSTKQKAEQYIGPQNVPPFIKCTHCGEQIPNSAYNSSESWKDKLSIREWSVQ